MKRLFILVMVAAIAYGGYWFVGARTVQNGAVDALTDLQDEGWQVSYDSLRTRGFPSRFDTTATEIALTTPDGMTYAAPFLQAFALSYRPTQMIVAFPTVQTLSLGAETITLASDGMRASGAVRANQALSFAEATLVADMLAFSDGTSTIRTGEVLLAARAAGDTAYDVYAGVERISLPEDYWQRMFPDAALPLSLDSMTLDASITLTAALDRFTRDPQVNEVTVKQAQILWGDLDIRAAGALSADAGGFAEGQITIEAVGLDLLFAGLINIGAIEPERAPMVFNMLDAMTDASGQVTIPLTFANGQLSWGFLPLGVAPRLR